MAQAFWPIAVPYWTIDDQIGNDPLLIHEHGCVSTPPGQTARVAVAGRPAIFRGLPQGRHAPPVTARGQPAAPSGHHEAMSGIAGTPMRLQESLARNEGIFGPLQN